MPIEPFPERVKKLRKRAIAYGDSVYDADFGLCTMTSERAIYNGHGVTWISAPYCRLLFEEGERLDLANHILSRILEYQYLDAGHDNYGNFLGFAEWDRVKDNNAISFGVCTLGGFLLEFPEKISPENTRKLREVMEIAAVGLMHRTCIWFYTNIFLLNLAGHFILAQLLNRPDLSKLAVAMWDRWLERTSVENVSEFNSNTYTQTQFGAILDIERYSTDPRVAREARMVADYLVTAFAANFHMETKRLTGTMSRAYRGTLLANDGADKYFAYYLFGIPEQGMEEMSKGQMNAESITRYDYTPPQQAVDLAFSKAYPFELTERTASFWGKDYAPGVDLRKNYQTKDFSFSTYNGVWAHYGHEVSFLITIPTAAERRLIFMEKKPEYAFIDMYLSQEENWAVGGMYHYVPDWNWMKLWWKERHYDSKKCLNFGPVEDESVLLDGKEWDGRDIDLTLPANIAVKRSGVMIGARAFSPPSDVNLHEVKVRLEKVDGDTLLSFEFLDERDIEKILSLPPAVVGLAVGVEAGENLHVFAEKLSKLGIQQSVSDDVWKLSAKPRDRQIVSETPLTPDMREKIRLDHTTPITEPMLECPGIRIMPGDWIEK